MKVSQASGIVSYFQGCSYIALFTLKAGATLYKLQTVMKTNESIKVGDKVTFDNDKIEIFKSETCSNDKAITQYQQLILAGVDQVGVVKELGGNLTTVSYPDGWDLPVPTKYLIVLPCQEEQV